jgi:hypothetical protein
MAKKRGKISGGAIFEDVEALLLKAAKQLRTMAPPAHVVVTLNQIEADVERMRAQRKPKPALL